MREINRRGRGLEIGPLCNPIAPKREGFKVEIVDIGSKHELIDRSRRAGLSEEQISQIEEVDHVWSGGRSYFELTGNEAHYDWIIASHVIEHVPNLIGFLDSCATALKDDGVLCLVVPDKRYCFDHFRPLTGLATVVDAAERDATCYSAGTAVEAALNAVSKGGRIAWEVSERGEYELFHTPTAVREIDELARQREPSADAHAWCFTPSSFRLLLNDLNFLGLTRLTERNFHSTIGCEFLVSLTNTGPVRRPDRLELLRQIDREIVEGIDLPKAGRKRSLLGWLRG